jgi:malonyl-CoA/methylmalonyl-CoA synthetase
VPAAGARVDAPAILGWARERLANYQVPRHVIGVAELPTHATGKVEKNVLRARAEAELGAS